MLNVNDIAEIEPLDMTQLSVIISEKEEELFDIKYHCYLNDCIDEDDQKKIDQIVEFMHHCHERLNYLKYWLDMSMMEEKGLPF